MKRYCLNRKNKKSYSLDDLTFEKITKDTEVRVKDESAWTTAGEIEEINEWLLKQSSSYSEIRKHHQKRFLISGVKVFNVCLLFFIISLLPDFSEFDGPTLKTMPTEWKMALCALVMLVTMITCLYDYFYHTYYRLIKKTEKNKLKTNIYYQIQSAVSLKKEASDLNGDNMSWSVEKVFYDESSKDQAKTYFDKLTVEKMIVERVVRTKKARYEAPGVFEFLREKNKILYFNPIKKGFFFVYALSVIAFIVTYVNLLAFIALPLQTIFIIIGVVLISLFVPYFIIKQKIKSSNSFLRIIQRSVRQGMYHKISHHLQSCTANGDNEDWNDFNIVKYYSISRNGSRSGYHYIEEEKKRIAIGFQ